MTKPEKQFEREFYRRMEPYPVIETARLRLRRVFRADAEDLSEATGDPRVTKFEPWGPYTKEETVQMLENILAQLECGLCTEWAVERKEDAKVLGLVHLNQVDFFHRSAEIGYWFSRKTWGQGYATEAVGALTEYAIKTLRMDEIIAICHPENGASLRVLEKIGMTPQKTLPQYISLRGKTADCLQYHITRWDFLE